MLLEQAMNLLKTTFADYRITSYKDLGDMYVFEAYSPAFDAMEEPKVAMDPWYYVNKQSGDVDHYYPFTNNPQQFFETESIIL